MTRPPAGGDGRTGRSGLSRWPRWVQHSVRAARQRARTRDARHPAWRAAKPLAFAGAGVLLVVTAVNAGGTDLRPERYDDLADLAQRQSARVERLQQQIATLQSDIDALTADLDDRDVQTVDRRIRALQDAAGMTPVTGPGVTITLDDAPPEVRADAGDEISSAIVHQQDIQAVVNALWAGGAEAMMLQGQRIIATTGIKCVGNTVILHGVPYSPPYVISAVGDSNTMLAAVAQDPYIATYLDAAKQWQLGWDVVVEDGLEVPAFTGSTELRYAVPAPGPDGA